MDNGVIYNVSGEGYRKLAIQSAQSLKRHNENLHVTLFTDEFVDADVFDNQLLVESPIRSMGDSILSEAHFEYNRTLYLDADTYVSGNLDDIFELLDQFDIAIAQNRSRSRWTKPIYSKNPLNIPESFPEYNSGVIAYKNNPDVGTLFENWNQFYHDMELDFPSNQPALRYALYSTNIDIGTLPPEYNFMFHKLGYACGKVKIFHQGPSELDPQIFAKDFNQCYDSRVLTWERYPYKIVYNDKNLSYRLWRKLSKINIRDVVSLIIP